MYQALYRKWRPRSFDEVVGQKEVTDTLKTQIMNDRLSHAYLFVGTRGTGKTTCAKILARAVNCEHPENGNPCNKCKSCLGIEDGSIMDVVELDAASNNGVDNVRALRDEAVYSPAVVKKRVYIIDEVHMLSTSAFNALLKILEEPPEHLIFILATTELGKVPATILSRCQRYRFRRLSQDVIADRIKYVAEQENMSLDPDAADLLASLADGALRDGLSLLDQCSVSQPITAENVRQTVGLAEKKGTSDLLSAISNGDTENAIVIFEDFWQEGSSPAAVLTELSGLLRDILILKVAPEGGRELLTAGYDLNTLKSFAEIMSNAAILSNIDYIMSTVGSLRDGRDPKITAELCIIGLCDPEAGNDLAGLRTRVEKLETSLASGNFSQAKKPIENDRIPQPKRVEQTLKQALPDIDDAPFDLVEKPIMSESDNNISKADTPEQTVTAAEELFEAPAQKSSPTSSDGDSQWGLLHDELMKTMPPFHRVHLSDATAEISGGTLTIQVTSSFKKTQLEKPELQEFIRNAMTSAWGAPIPFRIIESASTGGSNSGKLDALLQFGNVKCE